LFLKTYSWDNQDLLFQENGKLKAVKVSITMKKIYHCIVLIKDKPKSNNNHLHIMDINHNNNNTNINHNNNNNNNNKTTWLFHNQKPNQLANLIKRVESEFKDIQPNPNKESLLKISNSPHPLFKISHKFKFKKNMLITVMIMCLMINMRMHMNDDKEYKRNAID